MNARIVSRKVHAYIDYPVSVALIVLPLMLGLGKSSVFAFWISFGAGLTAFLFTLMTDHETGLFRLLPYSVHLIADVAVGLLLAISPFIFGFTGIDAIFYWFSAVAFLTIVCLKQPACASCQIASSERNSELSWNEMLS